MPAPTPLFKDDLEQVDTTKQENQTVEEAIATTAETASNIEEKPKTKRGRKPGSKNKNIPEKTTPEEHEEIEIEAKPVPVPIDDDDMELPPLDLSNSGDFIPIEDLPSEKFEIPSELLGKFEATKRDNPVQNPKENKNNKFQQRQQQRQANNRNKQGQNNQPYNNASNNNQTSNQNQNNQAPIQTIETEPAKPVEKPY